MYSPCIWKFVTFGQTLHFPYPLIPGNRYCVLCSLEPDFFRFPHVTDIIHHLFFCVWLISFGRMSSRLIHVVASGRILLFFIFKTEQYYILCVCVCVCVCIFMFEGSAFSLSSHPSTDTKVVSLMNNAAMNMGMQMSLQDPDFFPTAYKP
jgi:hypothetical protein